MGSFTSAVWFIRPAPRPSRKHSQARTKTTSSLFVDLNYSYIRVNSSNNIRYLAKDIKIGPATRSSINVLANTHEHAHMKHDSCVETHK